MSVRVRFAPSPTGNLHIGNLRAGIFNWLFARHHKGAFLIRIEDTDTERSKSEYTETILASLAWAGLQSDEPIITQSDRLPEHTNVVKQLLANGAAYRCVCTPDEMRTRCVRQGQDERFLLYDGLCRDKNIQADDARSFVVRFALPRDTQSLMFHDLIRGDVTVEFDQMDDFIILRSDGRPTYNFVVVVDDAYMKISHVVRGEDHISNTPKQILLYQACGYAVPQFAHLPLILGPSGNRLSKRDAATSVLEYRQQGYLPDAMINYLVRLGWSYGDQEVFTCEELITHFALDAVGKKGSIFDVDKLNWLNSVYLRQMSAADIVAYAQAHVAADFKKRVSNWSDEQIDFAIGMYHERAKTVGELLDELYVVHDGPAEYNVSDTQKWLTSKSADHLSKVVTLLQAETFADGASFSAAMKQLAKQEEIKFVHLAQPLRIALVGKSSGPGLFELLTAIGTLKSVQRIQACIAHIPDLIKSG